jgi:hypothetical protein
MRPDILHPSFVDAARYPRRGKLGITSATPDGRTHGVTQSVAVQISGSRVSLGR